MLKKLLLICLVMLSICSTVFASGSDDLRVALVYGQYSAEISCDDEFIVEDLATGKLSTLPEGKYRLLPGLLNRRPHKVVPQGSGRM